MFAELAKHKATHLLGSYEVTNPKFKAEKIHVEVSSIGRNPYLPLTFRTSSSKQKHRMDIEGMKSTLRLAKARKIN